MRTRQLQTLGLALVALGPLALLLAAAFTVWPAKAGFGFPLDDSWIHLQFGRIMAAGEGLAYNSGEVVLGTTAPLWSALLALAHTLPGDAGGWALLFGILAHCAGVMVVGLLAHSLGQSRRATLLAMAWVASSGWLVWSAASGMEISLFVLATLLGLARADLELRRPGSLPLALPALAVAVLLRPEALVLLALACAELAHRRRFADLGRGLANATLVLAPWVLFAWLSTGSPLPTTYAVKAGASGGLHLPELTYLRSVFWILFQFQPIVPLLVGGGLVWLAIRTQRPRHGQRGSIVLGAWLVALPLALAAQSPIGGSPLVGNFGRYLFPLIPVAAILAAGCVDPLLSSLRRRSAILVFALLILPGVVLVPRAVGLYATNLANVRDGDLAAAVWLADRLPPGASIAVNDIGLIKYLLPEHRVVDLVGIAHPEVRHYAREAESQGRPWWHGVLAFLEAEKPDYVVVFSSWLPQLAALEGFVELHHITIPNNITMGGNEIVVWRTPWTRAPLTPRTQSRPPPTPTTPG